VLDPCLLKVCQAHPAIGPVHLHVVGDDEVTPGKEGSRQGHALPDQEPARAQTECHPAMRPCCVGERDEVFPDGRPDGHSRSLLLKSAELSRSDRGLVGKILVPSRVHGRFQHRQLVLSAWIADSS